jgi:NAD(P)-dependent dehydrogenase (short-subunit alcohol dehydrogenase family)
MKFLITGGSRGIGRTLVLDAIAAGHDAAFTYRARADCAQEVVEQARRLDPRRRCLAYPLDLRDSEAVEETGDRILDDLGGMDVVVCNAATNRIGLAATMSDEDWREVLDTNLSGTFYVCRFFLPTFLAAGRGRFLHISSVGMHGMTGQAAYCASKAGLVGLSGTLAKEYGRKGITSNVLVLGFFETDMTRANMSLENRQFWSQLCPVGRMGQTSEVAQAVLFLASDGAGFINSQVIPITGGLDWVQ